MTSIYIGPYLVIPPVTQTTHPLRRRCSNQCAAPALGSGTAAKYCANCGGLIVAETKPETRTKPLSLNALADKWTDYMYCPEYGQNHPKGDIWLPNHGSHGVRVHRGAEDDFIPIRLSALDGAAMLEHAERAYGKFVEALKADFGIEPFWEVGVVAYA